MLPLESRDAMVAEDEAEVGSFNIDNEVLDKFKDKKFIKKTTVYKKIFR